MPIPLMALPMLASLFGSDETNVTNTSASNIQFNPSIAISLGGGVNSTPSGSLSSDPSATTTSNDNEGGGVGGLGFGGSLTNGDAALTGSSTGMSTVAKAGFGLAGLGLLYYMTKGMS